MDHLPLPRNPLPSVRVPYVCGDCLFDGGDFETFPIRAGWPEPVQLRGGWPFHVVPPDNVVTVPELRRQERILQSWVFFGLLHNVLSPFDLYHAEDFIDGLHISTKKLRSLLQLITTEHSEKVKHCVGIAQNVICALRDKSYREFNLRIKVSLAVICNTIEERFAYDNVWNTIPHLTVSMTTPQWTIEDFSSLTQIWYFKHMRRNVPSEDLQIDPLRYKPKHVGCCTCDSVGPALGDLHAALATGIPTLDGIDVGTGPYVAISHVWADGLGNPHENTLPRCQIERLHTLISQISSRPWTQIDGVYTHQNLRLWCDTLCCPIDDKLVALAKMRQVYQEAHYVLVLDEELQQYRFADIGPLEAGFRVLHSRWMKRFWTYQEAVLARKLLIQFADGPVDVYEIHRSCKDLYHGLEQRIYSMVGHGFHILRGSPNDLPTLTSAAQGFAYRRISVPSDEPICISTVLGLNTARVAASPRIETIWQLLAKRSLPESVIFNTMRRLETPGYRWAPSTLQQQLQHTLDVVQLVGDDTPGTLIPTGFLVRRPGWRVEKSCLPGLLQDDFLPDKPEVRTFTPARYGKQCYNIVRSQVSTLATKHFIEIVDDQKEWFVILSKGTTWDWQQWVTQRRGLLVSKEDRVYRSHMIVMVDRASPSLEFPRAAEYLYADAIRKDWKLRALPAVQSLRQCRYILMWLPYGRQISVWLDGRLSLCAQFLTRAIKRRIIYTNTEAPKLPEVASLMQEAQQQKDWSNLGGMIIHAFMGRYVNITEIFDENTEWVVD